MSFAGFAPLGAAAATADQSGTSAVMHAVRLDLPEMTELLLELGADVRGRDEDGTTLLDLLEAKRPRWDAVEAAVRSRLA